MGEEKIERSPAIPIKGLPKMSAKVSGMARLWTIRVQKGKEDQVKDTVREVSIPMLSKQKGFLKLYVLRDRENLSEYSWFSFWSDSSSLEKALSSQLWKDAIQRFMARGFVEGQPRVTYFEVAVEHEL